MWGGGHRHFGAHFVEPGRVPDGEETPTALEEQRILDLTDVAQEFGHDEAPAVVERHGLEAVELGCTGIAVEIAPEFVGRFLFAIEDRLEIFDPVHAETDQAIPLVMLGQAQLAVDGGELDRVAECGRQREPTLFAAKRKGLPAKSLKHFRHVPLFPCERFTPWTELSRAEARMRLGSRGIPRASRFLSVTRLVLSRDDWGLKGKVRNLCGDRRCRSNLRQFYVPDKLKLSG